MTPPPTTAGVDLVVTAVRSEPVGFIDAERYRRDLAAGSYRPEWSWVQQDPGTGELLARALWWAPPAAEHPFALDDLWVRRDVADPTAVATALIAAGHAAFLAAGMRQLPEYVLEVPTDWRDDPEAVAAVAWRVVAAGAAGLDAPTERLHVLWSPPAPLPPRSIRMTFRPADDGAFLTAFAAVAQGSLDALTVRNVAAMGAAAQARDDLDFYLSLPGRREDWRLAVDAAGALVGLIVPSRSAHSASVSYLGVVPGHRGRGYVDDLLAEITHVHAAAGAPQITADTDTANAPMAAAFARAGYRVVARRLAMSPPAP